MKTMDYAERYGKWALVLGGSEGLGRATALDLAKRGMNVAVAARREGPLKEAAALIAERHGVQTKYFQLDLSSDNVVAEIEAGMGGEDVSFIVYNAATEPYGEFIDIDLDTHLTNIAVNVVAPTRIAHHFGRKMAERGRGGIVICGSLASAQGLYMWTGYGASKAYEDILGQGLWYELGRRGVGACTLMIGTTWTDNFQRTQQRLGGVFADGRTPDRLPEGMALPQLPEDASANLFNQIDKEWLPVIYANPEDEARMKLGAAVPLADRIRMAAQMQVDWYA
jgi:short-subunit dehydrogenase